MSEGGPHLFRWDLDKTYLKTEFETFRGMLRAAREKAEEKQAYPGARELLSALSKSADHRLGIVSGSPKFMAEVLGKKLDIDGVRFDQMVLKPQMESMVKLRLRALREQVGYKLPVLFEGRRDLGQELPETLVGDDVEMDAFVYSLYADLLAGRVPWEDALEVFDKARLYSDTVEHIRELVEQIEPKDRVKRILVHLDKRTAPGHFGVFGSRVVPFHNYFQAAAVLLADGRISLDTCVQVARALVHKYGFAEAALIGSLQDIVLRGGPDLNTARQLACALDADVDIKGCEHEHHLVGSLPGDYETEPRGASPLVSYPELFDIERKRRKERKEAAKV